MPSPSASLLRDFSDSLFISIITPLEYFWIKEGFRKILLYNISKETVVL